MVEQFMLDAVKGATKQAFEEFEKMKRIDWVVNRCGMAVLCMNMTFWTAETEESIYKEGNVGLQKFTEKCT